MIVSDAGVDWSSLLLVASVAALFVFVVTMNQRRKTRHGRTREKGSAEHDSSHVHHLYEPGDGRKKSDASHADASDSYSSDSGGGSDGGGGGGGD